LRGAKPRSNLGGDEILPLHGVQGQNDRITGGYAPGPPEGMTKDKGTPWQERRQRFIMVATSSPGKERHEF